MKRGISYLSLTFCILSMLCLSSCRWGRVSPGEYMRKIETTEALTRMVVMGQIEYTFRLMTPEAMALKDCYDPKLEHLDRVAYSRRLEELKGFVFFIIEQRIKGSNQSVLRYNISGRPEYEQRVMYYQFYAMNDLALDCDGRIVKPASYNYENKMDVSPMNTAVVAFPDDGSCRELKVTFDDRVMNNRFIKATFKREDINSLPGVSIK